MWQGVGAMTLAERLLALALQSDPLPQLLLRRGLHDVGPTDCHFTCSHRHWVLL